MVMYAYIRTSRSTLFHADGSSIVIVAMLHVVMLQSMSGRAPPTPYYRRNIRADRYIHGSHCAPGYGGGTGQCDGAAHVHPRRYGQYSTERRPEFVWTTTE